jgi:hypothetical protein
MLLLRVISWCWNSRAGRRLASPSRNRFISLCVLGSLVAAVEGSYAQSVSWNFVKLVR